MKRAGDSGSVPRKSTICPLGCALVLAPVLTVFLLTRLSIWRAAAGILPRGPQCVMLAGEPRSQQCHWTWRGDAHRFRSHLQVPHVRRARRRLGGDHRMKGLARVLGAANYLLPPAWRRYLLHVDELMRFRRYVLIHLHIYPAL